MPIEIFREPAYELDEVDLGARAAQALGDAYPGYSWRVHINTMPTGGVMDIECLELEDVIRKPFGITLKMSTVYADPGLKKVVMAGGLLLEFAEAPQKRKLGEQINPAAFWRNYRTWSNNMLTGLKG